jgi:CRISPR-associated protein Cmr4
MKQNVYTLKTITSLHCGIGSGQGDIDLPVAKSPVTGLPIVPGSSIKGVLKDSFQHKFKADGLVAELFGPDNSDHASAISIGDACLLALPVRSFFGGFAYLTSPLVLGLFREALRRTGRTDLPDIPAIGAAGEAHYKASATADSLLRGTGKEHILLEEIDLLLVDSHNAITQKWADLLATLYFSEENGQRIFTSRFLIADDNVLSFMAQTALPVDAHIAIDEKTGVVRNGALWYEESVPPEALFYGSVSVDAGAKGTNAQNLQAFLIDNAPPCIQVGGKATTGKGLVDLRFLA